MKCYAESILYDPDSDLDLHDNLENTRGFKTIQETWLSIKEIQKLYEEIENLQPNTPLSVSCSENTSNLKAKGREFKLVVGREVYHIPAYKLYNWALALKWELDSFIRIKIGGRSQIFTDKKIEENMPEKSKKSDHSYSK